jgi:hypothetical protein
MPLSNAERQARYRERHLDAGEKARIQLFLSLHARKQLDRRARHRRCVTALIEEWAASAERRATSRLSPKALGAITTANRCNGSPTMTHP